MTEGLRVAAGRSLHSMLSNWTRSKPRGFVSGVLLTAIVQSSGAVTVATIGFANAGLLTLGEAAWVVFGSNVGTTMTGWLVATVGLKVKISALALPFLGIGMALRILRPSQRLGGFGGAVAGFGALFLGLAFLKEVFGGLGDSVNLGFLEDLGTWGLVLGIGIGATLTMLMQSSSAALVIVLTACSQGIPVAPHGRRLGDRRERRHHLDGAARDTGRHFEREARGVDPRAVQPAHGRGCALRARPFPAVARPLPCEPWKCRRTRPRAWRSSTPRSTCWACS